MPDQLRDAPMEKNGLNASGVTVASAQREALRWIVSLLQENHLPFMICGGLAAIGYGSRRVMHDIDILVRGEHFKEVVRLGEACISKPARRYLEEREGWDIEYVQFKHGDIKIEVGSLLDAKIFNSAASRWVPLKADFSHLEVRDLFGIPVPLMNRSELIEYKRQLGRPVDLLDIQAITG